MRKLAKVSEAERSDLIEGLKLLAECAVTDVCRLTGIPKWKAYDAFKVLQNSGIVYRTGIEFRRNFITQLWKATQPRKAETWRSLFGLGGVSPETIAFLDSLEELSPSCCNDSGYYPKWTINNPITAMSDWFDEVVETGIVSREECQSALQSLKRASRLLSYIPEELP